MKILLLGEYSNLHHTLACGLRILGHQVTVASEGDYWKNYERDIDISRGDYSFIANVNFGFKLCKLLFQISKYDVVHLINPKFIPATVGLNLRVYKYIRKRCEYVFMGANGYDYYIVRKCLDGDVLRYSEFQQPRTEASEIELGKIIEDCFGKCEILTKEIAQSVNGISACLYEYKAIYDTIFPKKTVYLPLPINLASIKRTKNSFYNRKIVLFIGAQKNREKQKGTEILYQAAMKLQQKYPDRCRVIRVENLPFEQYQNALNEADILLDQLYSYTPSMNSLVAMSKGIVVVGGGEEENYNVINEKELRPIINVLPSESDVFLKIENMLLKKDIEDLSKQSIEYIRRHHDHIKVAQQYLDFWLKK